MWSTAVACLLQVAQEQGEDQYDCHDDKTAFAGIGVVVFVEGVVLVEVVGVFFGGFVVREHGKALVGTKIELM